MNPAKNENRAAKAALACRSFRGHDFEAVGSGWGPFAGRGAAKLIAWEKRYTRRADRRLTRAVVLHRTAES